jgi:uncharacterized membrane protein YwzB
LMLPRSFSDALFGLISHLLAFSLRYTALHALHFDRVYATRAAFR